VIVEVSVDGVNFFSGKDNMPLYFTYRIPPVFLNVNPIRQSVWGEKALLVTGTNFPDMSQARVICRFIFPTSQA